MTEADVRQKAKEFNIHGVAFEKKKVYTTDNDISPTFLSSFRVDQVDRAILSNAMWNCVGGVVGVLYSAR